MFSLTIQYDINNIHLKHVLLSQKSYQIWKLNDSPKLGKFQKYMLMILTYSVV